MVKEITGTVCPRCRTEGDCNFEGCYPDVHGKLFLKREMSCPECNTKWEARYAVTLWDVHRV